MSAASSAVEAAMTGPRLVSALLTVVQQLDLVMTCCGKVEDEVLCRGFSHRHRPWGRMSWSVWEVRDQAGQFYASRNIRERGRHSLLEKIKN